MPFEVALLVSLVISRPGFFTIVAPAGTSNAVSTRARGVARVPGPRSIAKQHLKDKWERYDTHSYNQD